jgi:hypothetical protein
LRFPGNWTGRRRAEPENVEFILRKHGFEIRTDGAEIIFVSTVPSNTSTTNVIYQFLAENGQRSDVHLPKLKMKNWPPFNNTRIFDHYCDGRKCSDLLQEQYLNYSNVVVYMYLTCHDCGIWPY